VTYMHARARARTHTHTHTHTDVQGQLGFDGGDVVGSASLGQQVRS
jgi:hypothetical protein